MFNFPLQQTPTEPGMSLPSGDIAREVSGLTVRVPEFLVMRHGRRITRCDIKTFLAPFMIHEALPTLTETAFGSHPCRVVSVTFTPMP